MCVTTPSYDVSVVFTLPASITCNNMKYRYTKVKDRLRAKLAARKKALSEKQNDSRPAKTNAKKSRKRTRQKKGQPRPKASWSQKEVLGKSKRCRTPERK